MASNTFVSNDNKGLLWEMLLSNNMFNGIDSKDFTNVKVMFENVIMHIGVGIKTDINKDDLLKLNKTAIIEIKKYLDIFKKKNNEDTFNNERVLVFDKDLNNIKNDFAETIAIKKPEEPEFKSNIDTPIESNNMNEMLEKLQRERNELLPLPPPSNNEEKKLLQIEDNTPKKISNIEDLFNAQTNILSNKKVSFNDINDNNDINDINDINHNNINNNINNNMSKDPPINKKLRNITDIISQEYRGEKKMNDNNKLTNIYNLLKDIDQKQEEIISLLKENKNL